MIPLKDNIPSRTAPVVNYGIIAACALVFLGQNVAERGGGETLIERYGMIPVRVIHPDEPIVVKTRVAVRTFWGMGVVEKHRKLADPPFSPVLTLLSCIFLHGGWMHFIGNMWFLYIFGDNVEDRLGHSGYLVFYLGTGVAASMMHLITNPSSTVPTIGASGAIAGVMGAYILLYPRAMVLTLVPIFYFLQIITVPAYLFLGVWFVIQFFQGVGSFTQVQSGGVAWWAHIGGFAAGAAVVHLLRQAGLLKPPLARALPETHRFARYRVGRW